MLERPLLQVGGWLITLSLLATTVGATFVSIAESGWTGNGDELVKDVSESTRGFTRTLAGLEVFLEHDVRLNLLADRYLEGPQRPIP